MAEPGPGGGPRRATLNQPTAQAPIRAMTRCSTCGQSSPPGARFCDECGSELPVQSGHARVLRIGREADNDICVGQNNPQVSRHHAQVTIQGEQMWIEDLGTANGTFVNGVRVASRTPFRSTDDVRLGSFVFNTAELHRAPSPGGVGRAPGAAAAHDAPPTQAAAPLWVPQAAPMVPPPHHAMVEVGVSAEVVAHLNRSRGWMKLVGVLMILGGVIQALTVVGIVVAWLPIWMGVQLTGAAADAETVVQRNDPAALASYHRRVGTFFTIQGVLAMLGLLVAIGVLVTIVTTGISLLAFLAEIADM